MALPSDKADPAPDGPSPPGAALSEAAPGDAAARAAVLRVAGLNGVAFVIESAVAVVIGSLALMADAIDFLEDTGLNLLALWALRRSARLKAATAMALGVILFLPGIWIGWQAALRIEAPPAPPALAMVATALAAFAVNLACAMLLMRHRARDATMRAVWFSARNDAAANLAVIGAAVAVYATRSGWPDLLVGLAIMALNLTSAVGVFRDALAEWRGS